MGKPGSLALAAIVMMACVVWARILPAQQAVSDTETIATETIGPETIDPATDCSITMTAKAEPLAMAALTITAIPTGFAAMARRKRAAAARI